MALTLVSVISLWSAPVFGQETTLYFYNPEVSTTRNSVLKDTFDAYLSSKGDFKLQPVADRETFNGLMRDRKKDVFILSDSHFTEFSVSHPGYLTYLRGLKDGKNTYRKMLLAKRDIFSKGYKSRATIASAASESDSRKVLQQILPGLKREQLDAVSFLIVPKDIDALLSVGFGLSDSALASEESLEKLSSLYKNQYQQLQVLGTSKPLKRLVAVVPAKSTTQQQTLVQALYQMDKESMGQLALKLLGLDGWANIRKERLAEEAIK
ncbi:MAG: PhnD/SsuA/transferrin family substrate-binding protein [Pseudomonadales bacterium]|nr:PhnD/SsuA/transferrin family substrate-binding protein [Pseudomonadales bacterium]